MMEKPKCFARTISNKEKCGGGWGHNCEYCPSFIYCQPKPIEKPKEVEK
jgi:hypothetical protein